MEGSVQMTTTAIALALDAYGMELRLWKEAGLRDWGATFRDNSTIFHTKFEEDNLTMAKLHVLGEARKRALSRADNAELPGCDTFFNAWKAVKIEQPVLQH